MRMERMKFQNLVELQTYVEEKAREKFREWMKKGRRLAQTEEVVDNG